MNTIESAKRAVAVMDKGEATEARWTVSAAYCDAADACIAAIREMKGEAVAWEYREKSRHGWHAWSECSKYYFDDYQNDNLTGGISCREFIEVRALYTHPAPKLPDDGGVKDSRDLSEAIGPEDGFEGLGFEKACE